MLRNIRLIWILMSAVAWISGYAAIARYGEKLHIQPDGRKLTIVLRGDEYCHYYTDLNLIPVFEKNGWYKYGEVRNDSIYITDVVAEDGIKFKNSDHIYEEGIRVIECLKNNIYASQLKENNRRKLKINKKRTDGSFGNYSGKKRGLVILVEFADLSMSSQESNGEFNRMFNQPKYTDNEAVGSVRDYFKDQSYGLFDLEFNIVGPVKMSKNYGYYGRNSGISGNDENVREMVMEACALVDEDVDFSKYDWDGDGEVEQIFLIYAGYAESNGAPANTIWPHESIVSSDGIIHDNVKIRTYACSSELRGTSGNVLCGIGTACHEFSHCLGFPDLYDTDYSGAYGMGYWDVMNSGSYNGPNGVGEVPCGYSAYERWMAGWLEPIELKESQHVSYFPSLKDDPTAYIFYNEANRDEYFILENRQPEKWFRYCGREEGLHGMLVSHIDYDEKAWNTNTVNPRPDHQRLSYVAADSSFGNSPDDLQGDLFPGAQNINWINSESHSDAGITLFNQNSEGNYKINKTIGSIIENDGNISFDFYYDSDIILPKPTDATDVDEQGYTANWIGLKEALYYDVEQVSSTKLQGVFMVTKKELKENVNDISFRFTWLHDDGDVKYRVRAWLPGMVTPWSDYLKVLKDSGIDEISTDSDSEVEYYGLDGVRRSGPQKGINIIKRRGRFEKIIIDSNIY